MSYSVMKFSAGGYAVMFGDKFCIDFFTLKDALDWIAWQKRIAA